MLRYLNTKAMGRSIHPWLDSRFHFSFGEYYNPDNLNFGILRALNDDLVKPGTGFDTHPHRNMEILSYVVDGELSHTDSMKNRAELARGDVQYIRAGTGIYHSEHNLGTTPLRFLQIWLQPDKIGYHPTYGEYRFELEDRLNKWLQVASPYGAPYSRAPISIHTDAHVYASEIEAGKQLEFPVAKGRQAYMVLLEGSAQVNDLTVNMRDALEVMEEDITVTSTDNTTHALIIEMAKA